MSTPPADQKTIGLKSMAAGCEGGSDGAIAMEIFALRLLKRHWILALKYLSSLGKSFRLLAI
ncbi:hypothetical protein L3556_06950 [Candidatus Synechococcus calcipolaris G9]|uniref:Uncharacterized protein n=1 Tax=Candidatus Synechococcus calcipolaris G9 TaxID=1497997 RepID=A0ABT6EY07_9SYNE|nr:hypothetical protein [Candidatus Synechococcus calcipolaris]MDG2990671.1 hypothetical protein [Candidatus Synechococcus calcipolaris G9]